MSVAGDELFDGCPRFIGQENRGLLMAEIEDVDLPERAAGEADLLLVDTRSSKFARGYVEVERAPGTPREQRDLLQELGRASAQGDEGNPHRIEPGEVRVRGQPRVKH